MPDPANQQQNPQYQDRAVGFVGLGVMGYPMAGHLAAAGLDVTVFNRTPTVSERWVSEHTGKAVATPKEVAEHASVVFLCVGNDADVRSVCYGEDGVLAGLTAGKLLIDHTTASSELARELAGRVGELECGALDAPVSGGQAGAEQGILTVMVGGEALDYERASPLFDIFGRAHRLMGAAGAGQLTKVVNQICIAGVLQGLAEGLNLGRRVGLDLEAVVDVISKGAAQSWQMENRHKTMAAGEFEFGFAVDWMRKDLDIALRTGREAGAPLPLTALVDQFYAEVQGLGGGRWDTSSLLARFGIPDETGADSKDG